MLRKVMILCALIFVFNAPAHAAARPAGILILVDLSGSVAHLQSAPVAAKMAAYVARRVAKAPLGSMVSLRTLGQAGGVHNWLALDYRLSRKRGSRPKDVARRLSTILANLPKLTAQKKLALQGRTHIIRALQGLPASVCPPGGTLILLSDLMEHSPDADCYRLVTRKDGSLPPPRAGLLKGVSVIGLGAGHGLKTSHQSRRLQVMWTDWFARAGAKTFQFIARL